MSDIRRQRTEEDWTICRPSSVLYLQIMPALLHLGAYPGKDVLREPVRPLLHAGHALVEHPRLLGDQLLAERRLVEGERVLELGLGEPLSIETGHVVEQLFAPRSE